MGFDVSDKDRGETSAFQRKGAVTLRDIAQEVGVSHVTVSLALRNHPRISTATRLRVKKKADEMGYFADPMLSGLARYRMSRVENCAQATLAWINPSKNPRKIHPLEEFNRYRTGASDTARQLGFNLEEFATEKYSFEQMDREFKTRNIRGMIIAPFTHEESVLDGGNFPLQDYAGVCFGHNPRGPFNYVTSAQVFNITLAFEKALEKGYRRIGYVGSSIKKNFCAGYLNAQHALMLDHPLPPLLFEGEKYAQNRARLADWMDDAQPDAILCGHPLLISMLEDLGYSIPGDVGVATMSIHDSPVDAGINQNPEEIGSSAVRVLVSLLNLHDFGPPLVRSSTLIEGQWIDGSMLPVRDPGPAST
jgi:DNA-binding LacI/PurR family transcriptional regulator